MRKLILASFFALSVAACSSGGGSGSNSGGSPATTGLTSPSSVSVIPGS